MELLALEFKKHQEAAPVVPVEKFEQVKHHSHSYATSWFRQLWLLSKRCGSITLRDKATNFALLGQTIIFSVILALIWLKEGKDLGGSTVQSIAGALFFIVVNQVRACLSAMLRGFFYSLLEKAYPRFERSLLGPCLASFLCFRPSEALC